MSNTVDSRDFQKQLDRLEGLLAAVERSPDQAAIAQARELVQAVLDLHRLGLSRIIEHLETSGDAGATVLETCVDDKVVGGLLLLHGLHPKGLEERVLQALDEVRPYLRSHGGDVEFLGIADDVIHLRLEGNCHGCPSSAATMKHTIEEAIFRLAPEASTVEVEGLHETSMTPDGRAIVTLSIT
jgi:Fe-S cluster biogenesis protein NfuA